MKKYPYNFSTRGPGEGIYNQLNGGPHSKFLKDKLNRKIGSRFRCRSTFCSESKNHLPGIQSC